MEQPSRIDRNGSLIIDFITAALMIILLLNTSRSYLAIIIAILIPVIYYPCFHTLFSRSIGDMVFNLKVVDQGGHKIGFRLALKRFFCVLKYSIFVLLLTNLLFFIYFSRSEKDIRDTSFDFEAESKTYLVKTN